MNATANMNTATAEEENAMNATVTMNTATAEEENAMNATVTMNTATAEEENTEKKDVTEFSPKGFAERMVESEKYRKLSLPAEGLAEFLKKKIAENGWRVTKILSILTSKREYIPEGVEPELLFRRGASKVSLAFVPYGSGQNSHTLYVLSEWDKHYKLRNFCSNSDRPLFKYYEGLLSKLIEKVDPERSVIFYLDNSADVWEWNRKHYGISEDEVVCGANGGMEKAFVCGNAIHISDSNLLEPEVVHFWVKK